jgi:hypothetical protein
VSAYTIVSNDPLASSVGKDAMHGMKEMGPTGDTDIRLDPQGVTMKSGRGVVDPTLTYFVLYRDMLPMYFWPNAARNGFECSPDQP